jgi:ribosomal protein S3
MSLSQYCNKRKQFRKYLNKNLSEESISEVVLENMVQKTSHLGKIAILHN